MPKTPDTITQVVRKPTRFKAKSKLSRQYPQLIDKQWVTGYVKTVITSRYHRDYTEGPKDINSIIAIPHGDNLEAHYGGELAGRQFYPLMRGIVDVPSKGDQVLLCMFGGVGYYLGPLNVFNKVCNNADPKYEEIIEAGYNPYEAQSLDSNITVDFNDQWAELGMSPYFPQNCPNRLEKPYIHLPEDLDEVGHTLNIAEMDASEDALESKIREIPGDLMIEGKFGNSIRLGNRSDSPILTISNRGSDVSPLGYETTNNGSIFTMIAKGNIDSNFEQGVNLSNTNSLPGSFTLSSDIAIDSNRKYSIGPGLYDYRFGSDVTGHNHQVLLKSDRVTIDAYGDSIFLTGRKGVVVGSGHKSIVKAHKSIHLESEKIFLGGNHQDEVAKDPQMIDGEFEPLAHGNQLVEILKELIKGLKEMTIPTSIGPQTAVTVGLLPALVTAEQTLKTVLSKKVFIENHTK